MQAVDGITISQQGIVLSLKLAECNTRDDGRRAGRPKRLLREILEDEHDMMYEESETCSM